MLTEFFTVQTKNFAFCPSILHLTNWWLTLHGVPWSFFNAGHCNKLATLVIFYGKPTCSCFCIYFNDILLHRFHSIHNILSKWKELIILWYAYIYLNGTWNESTMNKSITWQNLSSFNNVALKHKPWKYITFIISVFLFFQA